jgi:hypothetical protein
MTAPLPATGIACAPQVIVGDDIVDEAQIIGQSTLPVAGC